MTLRQLSLQFRHEAYLNLDPDEVVETIGQPAAIIDCFGILTDEKIQTIFSAWL